MADEDEVAVAAITVAELLVGVRIADRRHRRARQEFVDDVTTVIDELPGIAVRSHRA